MRRTGIWIAGLAVTACAVLPAGASTTPETDKKIREGLLQRKFVARVELYEATVDESGKVRTESDKEAIKPGMPVVIDRIHIAYDTIRIYMKHPTAHEKTWVQFVFAQEMSPDFSREKEPFERMLAAVYEEKDGQKPPKDGE